MRTRSRSASESSESSQSPGSQGSTPSTGRPVRPSNVASPGRSRPTSPRNLLTTKPDTSAWSAASRRASVPCIAANTPPRSMSPTSRVGIPPCRASPMLTKSCARRLISAGLPAPSQTTTSYRATSSSYAVKAASARPARSPANEAASRVPAGLPRTTTWLRRSLPGLSSTGFIADSGSARAARACTHWARPISVALGRDHRVVGHVLRLERRHPHAAAAQRPAQPGGDHGLARVGGRAGDEEAAHGRPS